MTRRSSALYLRRARPLTTSLRRSATGMVSPDIVPVGPAPPPNAADLVLSQFDIDPAQCWALNAPNQIFVRGVNASSDVSSFEISMFYQTGVIIPWPDLLLSQPLPTSQGVRLAAMPATRTGERFVTPLPFLLNTASQAVSLLAAVTSRTTPDINPGAPVKTADALVAYYSERPNVAVRNAVVVPVVPKDRWSYGYRFESRQLSGESVLTVSTWRTPIGWKISLIYLPESGKDPVILLDDRPIEHLGQTFTAVWPLQPGMKGTFIVHIDPNGIPPTRDWRVDLILSLQVGPDHGGFARALAIEDVDAALSPSIDTARVIPIGGFVIMAKESNAF